MSQEAKTIMETITVNKGYPGGFETDDQNLILEEASSGEMTTISRVLMTIISTTF